MICFGDAGRMAPISCALGVDAPRVRVSACEPQWSSLPEENAASVTDKYSTAVLGKNIYIYLLAKGSSREFTSFCRFFIVGVPPRDVKLNCCLHLSLDERCQRGTGEDISCAAKGSRCCSGLLGCFPAAQPLPPSMGKCSHKPQAPSCSTVAVTGTGTKQYGDTGRVAGSQPAHPRVLAASFLLLEPVIRDPLVHTGGDPTAPVVTYKCPLINKELHPLLQDPGVTQGLLGRQSSVLQCYGDKQAPSPRPPPATTLPEPLVLGWPPVPA